MNPKQGLVALYTVEFIAFTLWAVWTQGWSESWAAVVATPANLQVLFDLITACSIALVFLWMDARRVGINPLPYVVLTAVTGSIGLLAYAVRRLSGAAAARTLGGAAEARGAA